MKPTLAAPPHPRGSTPYVPEFLTRVQGSPAPAGIDLSATNAAGSQSGLPRTRKDRPDANSTIPMSPPAPPHPRGSTPGYATHPRVAPGSPAPAGIDPRRRNPLPRRVRLPRTRGDRPEAVPVDEGDDPAPPHPRGSTQTDRDHANTHAGSPAPAGIDPEPRLPDAAAPRLPRTRGDRPRTPSVAVAGSPAPPHPRGSTPAVCLPRSDGPGSPAPAGIDPTTAPCGSPTSWLPRTRGDRPSCVMRAARSAVAPPHPRGSTLRASAKEMKVEGSPAPAGIDPFQTVRKKASNRLPRTRGDRPCCSTTHDSRPEAPPHPRGSTLSASFAACPNLGSPAPAGIDPRPLRALLQCVWLPRTRGDRFIALCPPPCPKTAPPQPKYQARQPRTHTPETKSPLTDSSPPHPLLRQQSSPPLPPVAITPASIRHRIPTTFCRGAFTQQPENGHVSDPASSFDHGSAA